MDKKEFKKNILYSIDEALNLLGFKETSLIYSKKLNTDVIAWIGLNTVEHQKSLDLGINPVIGIRQQKLEKIIAELRHIPYKKYSPPTMSKSIGYIMPQNTYIQFDFYINDDVDKAVNSLINAIREYAEKFFYETSSLESICKKLEREDFYRPGMTEYRLPCCYYLLKDYDKLKKCITTISNANHDNKPPSFINEFKQFSEKLLHLAENQDVNKEPD